MIVALSVKFSIEELVLRREIGSALYNKLNYRNGMQVSD